MEVRKCSTIRIFVNKKYIFYSIFFCASMIFALHLFSLRERARRKHHTNGNNEYFISIVLSRFFSAFLMPLLLQEQITMPTVVVVAAARSDRMVTNLICWIKQNGKKYKRKVQRKTTWEILDPTAGDTNECIFFFCFPNVTRAIKSLEKNQLENDSISQFQEDMLLTFRYKYLCYFRIT